MVTTSLLGLDVRRLLRKAEHLTRIKFPKEVVEVTLEPKLKTLCIRFKKPKGEELGEPVHPQVFFYEDGDTIVGLELLDIEPFS